MTQPSYPRHLTDRNGFYLREFSHVKITHPRHSYYLQTGRIVRIEGRRVWIAIQGGTITTAGHRSVEII